MTFDYRLFIGGKWLDSSDGGRFPTINPYNRQTWATIPQATVADVHQAIDAARTTYETLWRKTTGVQRANLLYKLADLVEKQVDRLSMLESTDNGKVVRETKNQVLFAARQYRFFAGYADKLWGKVIPLDQRDVFDYAQRTPVGVAILITAWNSPLGLLSNKLAPALAAGNCVVVKPSEHASATTLEFCSLVEEAGFPAGVVNVVTGDSRTGQALLTGGRVDRVSFTGSVGVGRQIAASAAQKLVPVTLELGGKSPNVVFADAEMDKALVGALAGIFSATGQTCIAGSRLLLQKSVHDQFIERLASRAKSIVLGDPTDPATEMGAVANEPQYRRILDFVGVAKNEGARLVTGGAPANAENLRDGLFIQPTIFADVSNKMTIAKEEVFGPVLSVIPFEDEEEAVEIANATEFGLAAGIWTTNLSRALRVSRAIDAGTVWVNTYRVSSVQAPFGGIKNSGYGRERGEVALDEFTACKNVMIDFSDDVRDPFSIKT
jgi:acyl-CoA reductase-like NAD-dependent aldehyde dehydrogenase